MITLPDHISYSQIDKFLTCPRKWWFDYIKYPEDREQAWAFVLGTAYHACIEEWYSGGSYEDGMAIYDESFAKIHLNHQSLIERDQLRNNLREYFQEVVPMYYPLVKDVEVKQDLYIDGVDVPIEMRLDLVTIDDRIADHKTVGRSEPSAASNKQLLIYSYWFLKKYGRLPRAVELHKSFKQPFGNKPNIAIETCEVSLAEVLKVVELFRDTYQRMKLEMFTPMPGKACEYCRHREECDLLSRRNG